MVRDGSWLVVFLPGLGVDRFLMIDLTLVQDIVYTRSMDDGEITYTSAGLCTATLSVPIDYFFSWDLDAVAGSVGLLARKSPSR